MLSKTPSTAPRNLLDAGSRAVEDVVQVRAPLHGRNAVQHDAKGEVGLR